MQLAVLTVWFKKLCLIIFYLYIYNSIQHNEDDSPENCGCKRLALRTGRFTNGEVLAPFPFSRELGGLQSRCGLFREVFYDCW